MKLREIYLVASLGLLLAGCASTRVYTDYDQDPSLHKLRTYSWKAGGELGGSEYPAINSPLMGRRIREAVGRELDNLGYEETLSDADFEVAYHVVTDERIDISTSGAFSNARYSSGGFYGPSFYGRYFSPYRGYFYDSYSGGYGGQSLTAHQYLKGTLVIDIVDGESGELLWRGWAEKSLDLSPEPADIRMYVDEAVVMILEQFPPTKTEVAVFDPQFEDTRIPDLDWRPVEPHRGGRSKF